METKNISTALGVFILSIISVTVIVFLLTLFKINNESLQGATNSNSSSVTIPKNKKLTKMSSHQENIDGQLNYINDSYNFKIIIAKGWKVYELNISEPIINIYKEAEGISPPFSDSPSTVTHVSIFPKGTPKSQVPGETITPNFRLKEDPSYFEDYILTNGTTWATYAKFKKYPSSWNSLGFLYGMAGIKNKEELCRRKGKIITRETCDLFGGDQILYKGIIDQNDRSEVTRMMKSFKFTSLN